MKQQTPGLYTVTVVTFELSNDSSTRKALPEKEIELKLQTDDKVTNPEFGKWGTLNVLGQPAEPICNYYGCHHKFSLHGSRRCRCKHPTNKALGIQVRYL
jgi:hypothetical protein